MKKYKRKKTEPAPVLTGLDERAEKRQAEDDAGDSSAVKAPDGISGTWQ